MSTDGSALAHETHVFEVNLIAAVATAAIVLSSVRGWASARAAAMPPISLRPADAAARATPSQASGASGTRDKVVR